MLLGVLNGIMLFSTLGTQPGIQLTPSTESITTIPLLLPTKSITATITSLSLDKDTSLLLFGSFVSLKALSEQKESPVLCGPRGTWDQHLQRIEGRKGEKHTFVSLFVQSSRRILL